MNVRAAALVSAMALGCACSSSVSISEDRAAGSGAAGSGAAGGWTASAGDLFGCGFALSCPEMSMHIYPFESKEAVACAGELVASGEPGVLLATLVPGPDFAQDQSLVILRGDGTALVQSRSRYCKLGTCPENPSETLPWEQSSPQQICNIDGSDLAPGCADGAGGSGGGASSECEWWTWGNLVDCNEVESLECSDVAQ